jgi:hypothetical protein
MDEPMEGGWVKDMAYAMNWANWTMHEHWEGFRLNSFMEMKQWMNMGNFAHLFHGEVK